MAKERGATFVEYAVIFAVITVGSIAAIDQLSDNGEAYVNETASVVGKPYEAPDPALTTTTFPGTTMPHLTTTTTTTTTIPATTSTAPTTTIPATTTTAGPTTTLPPTTLPPTTTTIAPTTTQAPTTTTPPPTTTTTVP